MRGGFIHNVVLVNCLLRAFEREGWSCDTEVPVRLGEGMGFVDLVAELDGYCIAVEAELSAKRIERDLQKAQALHAAELWIVTPNILVAESVRRGLLRLDVYVASDHKDGPTGLFGQNAWAAGRCGVGVGVGVYVLTQGAATQRVRSCLPLFAGS